MKTLASREVETGVEYAGTKTIYGFPLVKVIGFLFC